MSNDPRDHAISVEVVKIAMNQDKNGYFLRLALHPNDAVQSLVNSPVGTRYIAAFVEVSDQGLAVSTPPHPGVGEAPEASLSHSSSSGGVSGNRRDVAVTQSQLLCRETRFQSWLFTNGMADQPTEEAAVAGLYKTLGISSRSDLAINLDARERWLRLRKTFMASIDL